MWKSLIRGALALAILGASVAIAIWLVNSEKGVEEEGAVQPGADVTVLPVAPGRFAPQAEWTGEVVARRQLNVVAALSGDVLAVPVVEGDAVASGTVLLRMDTQEVEWEIAQARTELRELELAHEQAIAQHETDQELLALEQELLQQAERAVDRERDLRGRGASTEAALEQAEGLLAQRRQSVRQREASLAQHDNELARLDLQQARINVTLERLNDRLARAEPEAQFDAIVDAIQVTEGQAVSAGQNLMSLYSRDSLVWRTYLPAQAPLGLQAQLGNQSASLDRRSARVADGSSSRRGDFPLPDSLAWVPGEVHSVRVVWPELENVQPIPSSALYAGNRIFLVNADDRLVAQPVEMLGTTRINGTEYWLADGETLPENGRILTTRLPNALNGLAVTVTQTADLMAGE